MLAILGRRVRLCDGLDRREVLRIGGLGFTGLMWSDWLRARAAAPAQAKGKSAATFGKAKACIVIFNYGGPSHLDIWDLKPDAPQEIRGEFKPAATNVPGIAITEHLPRLGQQAHRYAIIRSVNHRDNDHAIGTYLALTGYSHPKHDILGIEPPATPQDLPSIGSVVSKLRPVARPVFPYVTLGDLRHFGNNDSMGQNAGCLGKAYDPFTVPFVRPLNGTLDIQGVTSVMTDVDSRQLNNRRRLLEELNRAGPAIEATANTRNLDDASRKAYQLLSSTATRDAFALSKEPPKVHDFYGPTPFAQNCLLARRLVEAGVPLVTLYSVGNREWDTHDSNFKNLNRRERDDLHKAFVAQLARHGAEHARSHRLADFVDQYRCIRIEANVGAILAARFFPHANHDTAHHFTLFDVGIGRGFFHACGDDVAQTSAQTQVAAAGQNVP